MTPDDFQQKFWSGLLRDFYEFQPNNRNPFGWPESRLARINIKIEEGVKRIAKRCGYVHRYIPLEWATANLSYIVENLEHIEATYDLLADDYSKQCLVALLKLRVLGGTHTRMPLSNRSFWDKYYSVDKLFLKQQRTIKTSFLDWHLATRSGRLY